MTKEQLPQSFLDALAVLDKGEDHLKGVDYSVTTLLNTPRAVQLIKRHKDSLPGRELESKLATFLGTSIHQGIEKLLEQDDNYLIEHKMVFHDKPEDADDSQTRIISGTADCYDKKRKALLDHKTTTTFIHGMEMKPEWVQQLNLYAYFLSREGIPVDLLAINTIYKDWRKGASKYKTEDEYPALPVMEHTFKPWSLETQKEVYNKLLKAHIEAESLADELLPECPSDYCWEKEPTYAVYIPGATKATKLCSSMQDAKDYIKWKTSGKSGAKYQIEYRPGERTRCAKYCEAAPFCNQYQNWLKQQDNLTANCLLEAV